MKNFFDMDSKLKLMKKVKQWEEKQERFAIRYKAQ